MIITSVLYGDYIHKQIYLMPLIRYQLNSRSRGRSEIKAIGQYFNNKISFGFYITISKEFLTSHQSQNLPKNDHAYSTLKRDISVLCDFLYFQLRCLREVFFFSLFLFYMHYYIYTKNLLLQAHKIHFLLYIK